MNSVKSNIIFIVLYWFKICGLLHTSKVSNRMTRMGGGAKWHFCVKMDSVNCWEEKV